MHGIITEHTVDPYSCQHSIGISLVMSGSMSSSSHYQVFVKSSSSHRRVIDIVIDKSLSRQRQFTLTSQSDHRHNILQSHQSHVWTVLLVLKILQGIDYTITLYLGHYCTERKFICYNLPSTYCRFSWSIMTGYRLHISLRYGYSAQRILYLWYYYYNEQNIDLFELCLVYRIVPFRSDDYGTQSLQSLVIFYRGYIYICYQSTTQYTLAVLLRIYIRAFIIVVLSVHLVVISARGYSLLVLWQQLIWYYYIYTKLCLILLPSQGTDSAYLDLVRLLCAECTFIPCVVTVYVLGIITIYRVHSYV